MDGASLPPPSIPPLSPHWKHAPTRIATMPPERQDGDSLPPINHHDPNSKGAHDLPGSDTRRPASSTASNSVSALTGPGSLYPGPPPPYSFHSNNSHVTGHNGYISPPDSQRTSVDDKEHGRKSLPSIHEALGKDTPILYASTAPQAVSIPPPGSSNGHSSVSPTIPLPRSHPEAGLPGLPGPPNPYASTTTLPAYNHETRDGKFQASYRRGSQNEEQARRNGSDSNPPSAHPSTTISPIQPHGQSPLSVHHTQPSPTYAAPNQPVQAPPYRPFQAPYSYPPPATNNFAAVNSYNPSQPWRDGPDAEDPHHAVPKQNPGGVQHYGESVKRHLDIYDLETSLNELAEGCGRGLEFARHYGNRAHQTQRSGPTLASLPSPQECDEMYKRQERVLLSIARIRDVVITQQSAMAEQRNRDEVKPKQELAEDSSTASDKGGGFAGADPKKRRGRNAPPGRCHSCNRAETPEWRRGPDGARTLCNACGLHYAKITRKHGQKNGTPAGSNLRPKDGETQ